MTGAVLVCILLLSFPAFFGRASEDASLAPLRGPVAGFIYEPSAGLRPLLGLPGAASIGAAILPPGSFARVVFAPARDAALAVLPASGEVAFLDGLRGIISMAMVDTEPGPSRMVFSPDGRSAAFLYERPLRVRVMREVGGSKPQSWVWQPAAVACDQPGDLAVADGGTSLAISCGGCGLLFVNADGVEKELLPSDALVTFLRGQQTLVAVETGSGQVWKIDCLTESANLQSLLQPGEIPGRPAGLAVSKDKRRIIVATQDPAEVVVLEAGRPPLRQPSPVEPPALQHMAGGSNFLLSSPGANPLWLVDAGPAGPRIVFVAEPRRLERRAEPLRTPGPSGGNR